MGAVDVQHQNNEKRGVSTGRIRADSGFFRFKCYSGELLFGKIWKSIKGCSGES